jgi:cardiolipin synthase (CMP-forming)
VNLPNSITLTRMLMVPVLVWLMLVDEMGFAFGLFVVTGLSDALDGLIAKQFNLVTTLGRYLDPLADKLLLISIYITLGYKDGLPIWLVILVISRDALIIGGTILTYVMGNRVVVQPSKISKVNTASQICLAAVILAKLGPGIDVGLAIDFLIYLVGATTLMSGLGYLVVWSKANDIANGQD